MYFDNDWVMLFPFFSTRAEPIEQFSRLTGKLWTRCFLMNTNFYLTGVSNVHRQTHKCLLLFRINCINIGWCFFIQLNSNMHLHNLLFWSTFRKHCLLSSFHSRTNTTHRTATRNLLLNFHYITHWFYHFLL